MKLFHLHIQPSDGETAWIVQANSPKEAAEKYIEAAIDEEISIPLDGLDMSCEPCVTVHQLPDATDEAKILLWQNMDKIQIDLTEIQAWKVAVERGWDPEEGWPSEEGPAI